LNVFGLNKKFSKIQYCFFFAFLKFLCYAKLDVFRFCEKIQNYILCIFGKIKKNILCFLKKFTKMFEEKFWGNLGDAN